MLLEAQGFRGCRKYQLQQLVLVRSGKPLTGRLLGNLLLANMIPKASFFRGLFSGAPLSIKRLSSARCRTILPAALRNPSDQQRTLSRKELSLQRSSSDIFAVVRAIETDLSYGFIGTFHGRF